MSKAASYLGLRKGHELWIRKVALGQKVVSSFQAQKRPEVTLDRPCVDSLVAGGRGASSLT